MTKRILIASAWLNPSRSYDVATWKKKRNVFSVNAPMTEHFGLRFLKANHPEITILEYPTRVQYYGALKEKWDIVGISFYVNETADAIEMAHAAREHGIQQVWAGNYGGLGEGLTTVFDRIHAGWGEQVLADALGKEPAPLVHPPTYMRVCYRNIPVQTWGVLFSSRGCNKTCTFCSTPKFYKQPYSLDLDAVEVVLAEYKAKHVDQVVILDENFGYFEEHTEAVIELLAKFGLRWNPMTRVETLYNNYHSWKKRGLCGVSIGLESLNQDSLNGARKGNNHVPREQLLRWLNEDNLLVQTFYIIGFEQDTESSIRADIAQLKKYKVDAPQIQILTPQPGTMLFKEIERRFGLCTYDYSLFDTTHLVWNHPHITQARMRELMYWSNDELINTKQSLNTAIKIIRQTWSMRQNNAFRFSFPLWAGNINRTAVTVSELSHFGSREYEMTHPTPSDNGHADEPNNPSSKVSRPKDDLIQIATSQQDSYTSVESS